MDAHLPSNETLLAFSDAIPWREIERQKRQFNEKLQEVAQTNSDAPLSLETFADAIGAPVSSYFDLADPDGANVLLAHSNGHQYMLGSVVSARYRSGKSLAQSIVPYNMNPSVNHTNIHETDAPTTRLRAVGAELELGLLHADGRGPDEAEMQAYIQAYQVHARRLGITPQLDREACQYQVEAHVAPSVGYHRTRSALEGILSALVASSEETGLKTAIISSYPIESDFRLTDNPKVHTAVDLMCEVNSYFPDYMQRLEEAKKRYGMDPAANVVEVFRLQGCHIHMDLAGRSEALGLFTFYTLLRSATALAGCAVLKGGPFVNGTCDPELLCTREYLRRTTVTGRYLEQPLSPHLQPQGMARYADLMRSERVNAMARALLYEDGLGSPISAMHNQLGRVRPDLGSTKRICTLEATGMPVNVSASRQAAILTDFEFTHALLESCFRKYGCDLEPLYADQELWAIVGPLSTEEFRRQHDVSDLLCSDAPVKTAAGTEMSLGEFYELKRVYMHKHLADVAQVSPRDIDDVYMSLQRMLMPPGGRQAETVEQYIHDYKLRSTGNWGRILRNAFEEEGGAVGSHNPDAVLRVVNRVHNAVRERYLQN
ncbi:MAG: hypothetical protein SF029_12055 [bacterium]|nr:hypothetical protein [bacterium]